MEVMKFKAVIFDLDGTLINSLEDLADSMNSVLKSCGYPVHEVLEYKYFVGSGIRNLVNVSLPADMRFDNNIDTCYKQMIDIYSRNCVNKTRLYDGIIDLLDKLKGMNIKLAVLSNKADELTQKIADILFPGYFDIILGISPETKKKPDPSGALKISNLFGIIPKEIIYTGDTEVDMQTAANAGMFGVGVLWGFRTKNELINSGAKEIAAHPLDLTRFF